MTPRKPKLSTEALHQAILPPNNCQVKAFRDTLSDEERNVLDEALGYDKSVMNAVALRKWLLALEFDEAIVPSADHIQAHRNTVAPCRCRS